MIENDGKCLRMLENSAGGKYLHQVLIGENINSFNLLLVEYSLVKLLLMLLGYLFTAALSASCSLSKIARKWFCHYNVASR